MTHRELDMDLQDLFEGRLGGEALGKLQNKLREDPGARNSYRVYLLLHHTLKFQSKRGDLLRVLPMDWSGTRRQRRSLRIAGLAAAALLAVTAIVMALVFASAP